MRRDPPSFGRCRLCHCDGKLQRSHIVPEFLYKALYDRSHGMMHAHGQGHRGWQRAQKGIRERLLCSRCECFLNDNIEKPFRELWCEQGRLPDPMQVGRTYRLRVPYSAFKLFHLSVLWRASVSGLSAFAQVALGKHEEALRSRLLALDPGPAWCYPIIGFFTVFDGDLVRWISASGTQVMAGLRTTCMTYGGAEWFVGVASHRSAEFERVALKGDGTIEMPAMDATTSSAVQRALELVRVSPAPSK